MGVEAATGGGHPSSLFYLSLPPTTDEQRAAPCILENLQYGPQGCRFEYWKVANYFTSFALRRREEAKRLFEGVEVCADLFVQNGSSFEFPAHKVILASRPLVLKDVLLGKGAKHIDGALIISIKVKVLSHASGSPAIHKPLPKLVFTGVHPLTVLLLTVYLYTDDVPAIWGRRVGIMVAEKLARGAPAKESHLLILFILKPQSGWTSKNPVARRGEL